MGNTSKKLAAKCTLLTKDEQKYVASTFKAASRNSDKIREDDLIVSGSLDAVSLDKFWGPLIDPRLAQYLCNYLYGWGENKVQTCDFNRFAELYVYNVRGTVDERIEVMYNCLGKEYNESSQDGLDYQLLKEFCETISSTYMKIMKSGGVGSARGWVEKGFGCRAQRVQALGEAVATCALADPDSTLTQLTRSQIYKWLSLDTLLNNLSETVFITLYTVSKKPSGEQPNPPLAQSLLPTPEGLESMPDYPAFVDLSHIVWINHNLPAKHRHKWRFLFSSNIHGESFSTMTGRILDQGPSVVIIEDTAGYIFGGFASESWSLGPNFCGTEESFLFTLAPKMRVYNTSGYNNHYQYFNQHQKTMPNGLMMGGQFEFAGLWLGADSFGTGTSAESCTTFRGYRRLSKEANFTIASIEFWGVGDKPVFESDQDDGQVSILDKNPSAKAILEFAGKKIYSDGLRDPDNQ